MQTNVETTSLTRDVGEEIIRSIPVERVPVIHFESTYTPNLETRAVYRAGLALRYDPSAKLHNTLLEVEGDPATQMAKCALATIINTSQTRNPQTDTVFSSTHSVHRMDNCNEAEGLFLLALNRMKSLSPAKVLPRVITHKDTDEPILFGKADGIRSFLTLRSIAIDGVEYPVGSIVAARLLTERGNDQQSSEHKYIKFDESTVQSLQFLRLSRFAVSPREQSDAKWKTRNIPFEYLKTIGELSIEMLKVEIDAIVNAG